MLGGFRGTVALGAGWEEEGLMVVVVAGAEPGKGAGVRTRSGRIPRWAGRWCGRGGRRSWRRGCRRLGIRGR